MNQTASRCCSCGSSVMPDPDSTAPAGMPFSWSLCIKSLGENRTVHALKILSSSCSCIFRPANVENLGSSPKEELPMASHRFRHSSSEDTAIAHHFFFPAQG